MDTEMTQSLSRLIHQAMRHCQSKRLVNYDHVPLTQDFVNTVGAEMVDLFERRIIELQKKTPPAGAEASSGSIGGGYSRQRGFGRR